MFKKILLIVLIVFSVIGCSSDKTKQKEKQKEDTKIKGTLMLYGTNGNHIMDFKGEIDDLDILTDDYNNFKLHDGRRVAIHGGIVVFIEDKKDEIKGGL